MLSVLGLGLISPAGATARDHVFFPRAEAPPPPPSPFLGPDDRRIDVRYCPWLRLGEKSEARLLALARSAVSEALSALPKDTAAGIPLYLVTPAPRPGLPDEAIDAFARAVGELAGASSVHRFVGAAGVFAALAQIEERAQKAEIDAALVVGVDSHASVSALTDRLRTKESPWLLSPPPPAEGAGALLVASPAQAARWGAPILGEIIASRHAEDRATDENDEPVSAATMTTLLRGLPLARPIGAVFGQGRVDMLRCREWEWSVARCADRFAASPFDPCIEAALGALGAAAGALSLAFAFACFRHGVAPLEAASSFVAWAISRDGTRGIALASAPAPDRASALLPLHEAATARRVERDRYVPPNPSPEEDPAEDEAWIDEAPANDIAPALPVLPREIVAAPAVRLDVARAKDSALPAFYAGVTAHCAELAASLARARLEGRWSRLADTEARLLRQIDAIVASGPRALIELAAWWELFLDDPWKAFAGALGAAAFEGDDALLVIDRAIHLLPEDAEDHAITIAEALSLSSHPGLEERSRALSASAHAAARAIGVRACAARGDLPESALVAALGDRADIVSRAGIWASLRCPPEQRATLAPRIREQLRRGSATVVWSAARVLSIGGDREVFLEATEGSLGERLGPRVAELFALCGAVSDWPKLEARMGRHRATRGIISAVGRFGSAEAAPWLLQRLDDEALAEAAAEALCTLFGPLVGEREMRSGGAWRRALGAQGFDAKTRWRRGRPWSASVVAEECTSGDLGRGEVELRIDELRARLGLLDGVDVSGFRRGAEANLAQLLAAATARSGGRESTWRQ